MEKKHFIYFIALAIVLSSCVSSKKKEQTISISGAFALYPLVVRWADEYEKVHPEIRFNISGGGAGKGMADALAGAVDLGMFSREIAQEEKNQGVWWVGLTIDAVIPTISSENPFLRLLQKRGVTREEFGDIFIHETVKDWSELVQISEKKEIVVYTRSDACGAAETWAKFMDGKQEDLRGIGIYGDPGLAETVIKDPYGIGYNNTIFVYDIKTGKKRPGIEVIPLDINGNDTIEADENFYDSFPEVLKAIADGIYPSPPARELYFVSKGKPVKKSVTDFIKWTLTDGQKYVKEAGYVPIDQGRISKYLDKLK